MAPGVQHGLVDFLPRHIRLFRDFLGRRTALVLLFKLVQHAVDFGVRAYLVERQPYQPALLGYGLQDTLANPPHGVGYELEAARLVEALGSLYQPQVTLVDEVGQRQPLVLVLLGH